jgi:hypothetical protein
MALETELIDALIALPKMVGRDLCPPGVGIVRAEFASSRLWQPAENGKLLLVTGEFDGDEPVDIIAWRASEPRQWWCRTGHASGVLGEDHLRACRFLGEPPIVHPTPEAWCRAGGTGCVVLDGNFMRLIDFEHVKVDDAELAGRIYRAHRTPPPHLPKIWVRQPGDNSSLKEVAA